MLLNDLDLDWAYIHFYHDKENDMYHTTLSEKKLFMYVSHIDVWHYGNSGAPIRTIEPKIIKSFITMDNLMAPIL